MPSGASTGSDYFENSRQGWISRRMALKHRRKHLRGEDPEDRGQRVYGDVREGRCIRADECIRECESRWVGHAAGEQATEHREVHSEQRASEEPGREQRKDRDAQARTQPQKTRETEHAPEESRSG